MDLLQLSSNEIRSVRGAEIAMVFQDPMTSLTPVYTVGWQIAEQLRAHEPMSKKAARARTVELLAEVGISSPSRRVDDFPHQFSGGMRQRVMIAMALSCNPSLLIADEPTTALDVTIQAQILELMKRLQRDHGSSIILITHDMGAVADLAERVIVMYAGRIVEEATEGGSLPRPAASVHLGAARVDAARGQAACRPTRRDPRRAAVAARPARGVPVRAALSAPVRPLRNPAGAPRTRRGRQEGRMPSRPSCQAGTATGVAARRVRAGGRVNDGEVLLEANRARQALPGSLEHLQPGGGEQVHAVDGVSLAVRRGETLGIVGESGCGKSTLARLLVRLHEPTSGTVKFDGTDITSLSRRDVRPYRRQMQMIFQDPYASLNPRKRVVQIVGDPFRINGIGSRAQVRQNVQELLEVVGLSAAHLNRYPHEFSGGQRQRIGVARALALSPQLIVADEPVSALDVSIQAQVVNLLHDLQEDFNLTYVFIAHDLGVVRHVSDRVAVMYLGVIVEIAPVDELYARPVHPYTEALLSAIPVIETGEEDAGSRRERIVLEGEVPSPIDPPSGCRFHPRCRYATEICRVERPPLVHYGSERLAACHHPLGAATPTERE